MAAWPYAGNPLPASIQSLATRNQESGHGPPAPHLLLLGEKDELHLICPPRAHPGTPRDLARPENLASTAP